MSSCRRPWQRRARHQRRLARAEVRQALVALARVERGEDPGGWAEALRAHLLGHQQGLTDNVFDPQPLLTQLRQALLHGDGLMKVGWDDERAGTAQR